MCPDDFIVGDCVTARVAFRVYLDTTPLSIMSSAPVRQSQAINIGEHFIVSDIDVSHGRLYLVHMSGYKCWIPAWARRDNLKLMDLND